MRNGELIQMMYTPIPQNMTDSESEEEFHLQINNCPLKSSQIINKNPKTSNVHATISRYNGGDMENQLTNTIPNVRFANTQSNYCGSDGEDRPYISMTNNHHHFHHNRMPSDADNVAILNTNVKKSQPMSNTRKLCFIVSIIACIVTVILFIWILPCSDNHSCPAKSERMHTHNWLRSYERVELKGAINVVHGLRGRSMNLVFMYRGK